MAPSITEERDGLAAVGMRHRWRSQWGAQRSYTDARTVTHPATRVFIHISVTNPGNYNGDDAHARAIESIGISRFPNTGISYNRGIMHRTGAPIYEFQPIGRRGAHTVNNYQVSPCSRWGTQCPGNGASLTAPSWNLNYNARAYVICQNVGHSVTDYMIDQIARAVAADYLAGFITLGAARNIHGHRCVSAKSCPGDLMWARMHDAQKKINHYISNGLNGGDTMPTTREIWNTDLSVGTEPDITNLANDTMPDVWGKRTSHLLGYAASALAWLRNKTFSKPRFPDEEERTLTWFIRHGYSHAREGRDASRAVPKEVWAFANETHDDRDAFAILRHAEARTVEIRDAIQTLEVPADVSTQLAEIASSVQAVDTKVDDAVAKIGQVTDALDNLQVDVNADDVADRLRQLLHEATAPAESDPS